VKQHRFNSDKVVAEFGINVTEDLTLVDARVLPPPTVYTQFMLNKVLKLS
jgi:hypothetical protein